MYRVSSTIAQIKIPFSRRSSFDNDYFFDIFEERKGGIWESLLKGVSIVLTRKPRWKW
jgi:hypothetical protein